MLENKKFLLEYLNNYSPSGQENQDVWTNSIKQYVDKVYYDKYGTSVAVINGDSDFKFVIEAHADEIGWNINYISPEGYIYVNRNGGSDNVCAPGKEVTIINKKGEHVYGVFGQTAIHLRERTNEKTPKVEELFIDVGSNDPDFIKNNLSLDVGCKVVYNNTPKVAINNTDAIVSRAIDNRIGGYILHQVVKQLKERGVKLNFGLYIVNSVQEEVGLNGAKMIAEQLKPDVALVTDVCHDTNTPGIDKRKNGDIKIGSGPVISYAPSIHRGFREYIEKVASFTNNEYQKLSSSSHSGTDADSFAFSNGGIPTGLIKIPIKYMHTPTEMVSISDINRTTQLIYEVVTNFDRENL